MYVWEWVYKLLFTSTTSQERARVETRKTSDSVAELNKILENEENSDQLRVQLKACQHFLTDSEMENGRHTVFNFQLSNQIPI